jgi:lysophospholipase L1-like esterase
MKQSIFEQHPNITLFSVVCFLFVGAVSFANFIGGGLFGLGKVVLYDANPIYGYRAQPNQIVARKPHRVVKINNLGLRAEQDWDPKDFNHKILFLGDSVTYGGSYISNDQLFSSLVGKKIPTYAAGNAGVNGWGVNNVHAFIKEMEFLPAQVYVTMFPEGDFYRGLNRIGGQPFWTRKPHYALEELSQFFIYKIHLKKTPVIDFYSSDAPEKTKIVEIAVRNLKELDDYLKQNDRDHLIYISPSQSQVLQNSQEDKIIKDLLQKHGLKVVYIKDHLKHLTNKDIKECYHDEIHLSAKGHQVWADVIFKDVEDVILAHEKESILVHKEHENKNT